ncbi:MAG: fumarylacetoacetate hydrolase family protein [Frankiales bacterium]|nr:fumarylacetoacetate hydrolase family protein [Frankiales bacterium]MCW3017247.1 fumarylacetoacetate hydrolase family protein [Solirubrobacterales bacterium]
MSSSTLPSELVAVRIGFAAGSAAAIVTAAAGPLACVLMKLATFLAPGAQIPTGGEVVGDAVVAFADGTSVLDRLTSGDRTPATGASHPLADVTLLAPVPQPRAIFGIGLNYAAHAAEQGAKTPEVPIVFLMLPSSAAPPGGPVVCPPVVRRLDYEGELGVVMGAGGEVAGYVVCDDVSARDLQAREPQWTRAKGFDTSCPYGPWITTADEVGDPEDLRLQTWVNGELRQDARTNDLIFSIPELVTFISETCTLMPGDLIATGTPSGVGMAMDPRVFLQSGDVIRIEIESLGSIEHAVA